VLDFANSKTLDPRITFTRGSNAMYYDGTTALAEQNLFTYSQQFTSWPSARATMVDNIAVAPDGTTTATSITQISTGLYGCPYKSPAISGRYTTSVYAKAGTASYIIVGDENWGLAWFNLSAGTIGTVQTGVSASISSVGNGWYRCSVTGSYTSSQTVFAISSGDNSTSASSGTTIYIWGAQLEQRSSVSAYTPTTTTAISNYIPALKTAGPNQPRFDVDPITQESKGLLIEEQRTNLLLYSDQFDNAAWAKYGSTVTGSAIVAPDGSVSGEKVVETTANDIHRVAQGSISVTSGTTYTFSCYAKAGERTFIEMRFYDNANNVGIATYNLTNGTVSGITGVSASMIPVGNGWYRCVLTSTSANTTASGFFLVYTKITASLDTWLGNGYAGLYLWGAQVEVGSFATSYIPTAGATATRAIDAAVINGSNFSSWFNNTEGTVYGQVSVGQGFFPNIVTVNDGTNNNAFYISRVSSAATPATTLRYQWTNEAGVVNDLGPGNNVFAAAYKQADYQMGNNGSVGAVDTTAGRIPTLSAMNIGNFPSGSFPWNGYIKKLAYYPVRLTSSELQGLTAS
jgi:hypothetical protein